MKIIFLLILFLLPFTAAEAASPIDPLKKLTLSVKAEPVRLDAIPIGATRVRLLPLVLRAGCEGDIKLEYLRIKRIGPGRSSDIQGIYLLKSDRRITRTGTISSSGQTVLLGLKGMVVPRCKSVRLDTTIDIRRGTAAGSRFALSVENATDIKSNAEVVTGDFPIRTMNVPTKVVPDTVGAALITFQPVGKVQVIRDETLAKFTIEANGSTHQIIQGILLTNKGSARNDELRNLYLTQRSGRALTPVVKMLSDDQVLLTFSQPYFIRQGQTVGFELHGRAYRSVKTVDFTLEEPSDLHAVPSRRAGRTIGGRMRILRYGTE